MKDNLPYFSHDNNARRHPKMKALIAEFGYEGYGRFWALNERIAESSGAYIDISKKVNKLDLAQELGFKGEDLDRFLSFLADPEIDLINIDGNRITTDRITEIFEKTMESREGERDRKKGKKGKSGFPCGNNDIPGGNDGFPEAFRAENDTDKTKQDKTKQNKTKQNNEDFNEPSLFEKQALELSVLLLTAHRKKIPDFLSGKDKESIPRWADDIEKLIRIDKKTPEAISEVILWAKADNFWFANIISGKKLRDKFEMLYGQMMTRLKSTGPPPHKIAADSIPDDQLGQYFKKE